MNVQTFIWTSKVLQLLVAKLISTHNKVAWSQVCQHGKQYPLLSQPNGSKNWRAKLLANTYIFPPNGFQEGKHEHHWLAFIWKRPNISVQLPSTEWRSGLECWLGKMMMMPPSAIAGDWVNRPCIYICRPVRERVCATPVLVPFCVAGLLTENMSHRWKASNPPGTNWVGDDWILYPRGHGMARPQ